MCYQGNCVDSAISFNSSYIPNPCDPNPCQNGGTSMRNSTTGSLFCKCQPNVIYEGNKF
jgi:hypothetical protein